MKKSDYLVKHKLCILSSWCNGLFLIEWRNATPCAIPMAILTRVSHDNASSSVERNMKLYVKYKYIIAYLFIEWSHLEEILAFENVMLQTFLA